MNNAFISYSHSADSRLAKALQSGLEKFAKPWYKVRNLNIFQDDTSLTASPNLWGSIRKALEDSEYFIYMASPQAAASKWVQKEIEFWLNNKSLETFIIAVTDGNLKWSDEKNAFLIADNNCLPEFLLYKFSEEPLYIDLRNLKTENNLTLTNRIFKEEVLKIAAKLHNKAPKDLAGDGIAAHRKTLRIRNSAIIMLAVLFILAATTAWIAKLRSNEAIKEKNTAQANYLISQAQREASVDPTIALRLAEAAIKKNNDSLNVDIANKIYRENTFYKTILSEEFSSKNHYASFFCIDVSPDGHSFTLGSKKLTVKMYDLQGKFIREFKGYKNIITCIAYSPDGKLIATGTENGNVKLWTTSGSLLHEYETGGEIISLNFSANGNYLLLVSDFQFYQATLLDLNLKLVKEYSADIFSVNFSAEGNTILMAGEDNAKLVDINGKRIQTFNLPGIIESDFSSDGKYMIAGLTDSSVEVCKMDGTLLKKIKLRGSLASMAFSPDGSMFLITTVNGDVIVYDTDGEILSQLKGYTYVVNAKFLPDNKTVITIGEGTVRLWTLNNLPVKNFVYDDHINTVGFSPDNKQILIGTWHHARILSINGKQLSQIDPPANDYIASAKFSPSGNMILITSYNYFSIYNTEWKLINKVKSTATYFSIFSPDSKKVLLCLRDSTAKLFDLQGNLLQRFIHKGDITSACFSPDGKLLLTGTGDGIAYLWDMNGKEIRVFKDYGFTQCVAFSPDGKFVATAGSNFTVTLWNLKGNRIQQFKGHVSQINDMCFSPDGNYLYSCSADNTAKIWNMKGEIIKEIKQPGNITSLAVSADGKMFLTGSMNYNVKLWNSPAPLHDFLNSGALSELTDAQNKYYNIN